jgi:propanediol dehydratase small subunit
MNRVNNILREVFQRMNKSGSSAVAIAKAIGKTTQTIRNLKKIDEDKLFIEPNKNTRKPSLDLDSLKKHIIDNPFDFNKEIGLVYGRHILSR